jgi:hypothetical protein
MGWKGIHMTVSYRLDDQPSIIKKRTVCKKEVERDEEGGRKRGNPLL